MRYEIPALLVLCIVGTLSWGWFGIQHSLQITLSFGAAYALSAIIYRRSEGYSTLGHLVLVTLLLVLGLMTIIDMHGVLDLGERGFHRPALLSPDSHRIYHFSREVYLCDDVTVDLTYTGYAYFLGWLWRLIGEINIAYLLAINIGAVLLTAACTGKMAWRWFTAHHLTDAKQMSAWTMVLLACMAYFLSPTLRPFKEPIVFAGMALVAYVMVTVSEYRRPLRSGEWIALAIGILLLATNRNNLVGMLLLGQTILLLCQHKQWRAHLPVIALTGLIYLLGWQLQYQGLHYQLKIISGEGMAQEFLNPKMRESYYILENYYDHPVWMRTLMLPLTNAIQGILPLPFAIEGHKADTGMVTLLSRINVLWYPVLILTVFYYTVLAWRKNERLGPWAWWPLLCYEVIAYITAGTVSRYILPFMPYWTTFAVYTWYHCAVQGNHKQTLKLMATTSAVLLVIAIAIGIYLKIG